MSLPQLRRSLLDERWIVLWFGLGLAVYGLFVASFWPTFKQNVAAYAQFISAFPEPLIRAFGISDFSRFTGFIGTEYLNFMWPLIACVFVIMAGSATVAGEVDRGTVELWLSVPQSRWRLLAAKHAAILAGIAILAAVTAAAVALAARVSDETLAVGGLLAMGIVQASFCIAVAGYSVFFSALVSSRGAAAGLAASVTLASYLAGVVSAFSSDVDWLRYVALTSAFHPQQALVDGHVEAGEVAVLLVLGLTGSLGALVAFQRRDANP